MSVTILFAAIAGCSSPVAPEHREVDAGASDPVPTADPAPTAEGNAITDLRVESIDSSTVTLAFTQVADASGSPADYQIRYQEDRLTDWDTALPVVDGTCEGSLTGTKVGDPYVCTVEDLSLGVTYELQAVAFRSNQSSTVDGESQRVVAATPPPPDHQEDGEVITEHTFTNPVEDGWAEPLGAFSHGTENGDGYGQANYEPNLCVGCGPINTWRNFSEEHDEVTVRMRWKLSPNFNHATGSHNKKILFLNASGTSPIIFGAKSGGSFYFNTQRTAQQPNGARIMSGGSWVPGVEYQVTLYVRVNSVDRDGNSNPDGVVTIWVDGVQVMHATDFRFRGNDASTDPGWGPEDGIDGVKWNPTWPNGGDSPAESMWERIYHIEVVSGQG